MARRIDRVLRQCCITTLLLNNWMETSFDEQNFRQSHSAFARTPCPVAMPCSRSRRCWRSAEPSALSRRSGTVSNIPVPDHTAYAFSTSLRYDANGNLYAWNGLSVWELSGGSGQLQPHRLCDGRQYGRCGTDQLLSRWHNPCLLSNGAGGSSVTAWTTASSGPCRRREERPRRFRAAACPTPAMPWPCPPPRPFPDRARSTSSTKETAPTAAPRYRFSMPRPGPTRWSSPTAPEQRLRSPSIRKTIRLRRRR